MVEATDFANRDDLAEFGPLNCAAVWCILVERGVSTPAVVVREVASQVRRRCCSARTST